jgi:hypothetical protein
MATDFPGELQDFQRFLDNKLHVGDAPASLEQALEEFRAHQRDVEKFRSDTRQSLDESARGQSSPLDIDSVLERGRERLAQNRISSA